MKVKVSNVKLAADYFKSDKGFDRLFQRLAHKYASYDRETPGTVTLTNLKDYEKRTLSMFMKKDYTLNKSVSIRLEHIQSRIDETRFEGVTLKEVIEEYFEKCIKTNKALRIEQSNLYNDYVKYLLAKHIEKKEISELIDKVMNSSNKNSAWIKISFKNETDKTKEVTEKIIDAIISLPEVPEKLPVYCSRVFRNPHALDKDTFNQKMFNIFIEVLYELRTGAKSEVNSHTKAVIYYYFNLYIDDVSNMVLCKNILASKNKINHKGWEGFYKNNESIQVTLTNLSNIDEVTVKHDFVLVVENPSVFTSVSDALSDKKIPVVCTYGQLKLSGLILLELLEKKCKTIYYSGDIDPEGMLIADKLKTKFNSKLEFITFDKVTYKNNLSNVDISEIRLSKLNKLEDETLISLAVELNKEKKAVYEEDNIDNIVAILENKIAN